jgi:hypothetical protein
MCLRHAHPFRFYRLFTAVPYAAILRLLSTCEKSELKRAFTVAAVVDALSVVLEPSVVLDLPVEVDPVEDVDDVPSDDELPLTEELEPLGGGPGGGPCRPLLLLLERALARFCMSVVKVDDNEELLLEEVELSSLLVPLVLLPSVDEVDDPADALSSLLRSFSNCAKAD